jgi:hypothetical protein
MKISHWTLKNNSGMFRVAEELATCENTLGIEAQVLDPFTEADKGMDSDIHVSHTHIPDVVRATSKGKIVWIGHGTPEHCFQGSVEAGLNKGYGHADGFMLVQWWLQNSDALVTFWPRHQAIWQSLCDKNTQVHYLPLGVDKTFWRPVESNGKYQGNPSVFSCENAHYIKWPLDLVIMWPWISRVFYEAYLHLIYLPTDQHRWWFPLMNRNGTHFKAHINGGAFAKPDLRNAFASVDFFTSFVRYGDFNRACLEAKATGCKIISFEGNPYADYWIPEGDQRRQCEAMIEIMKGKVEPRETEEVPDIMDTAKSLIKEVYEKL